MRIQRCSAPQVSEETISDDKLGGVLRRSCGVDGDLTIWVTDDTLKQWRAPSRTTPGGQPKYSNIAIETCKTQLMGLNHYRLMPVVV